jgi:acyl-homoserine lactone acylase PvdQ
VAGLNSPNVVSQYWGMMRARHLREFIRANSRLQMPFFNVVYADRDGQIMYLFGGRQPRRSGDADAIAATDVLEKWDRESDANSQGAVLFERWYNLYIADSNSPRDDRWGATYPAFREEFSPESPLTTPVGLRNPAAAVPFLAQAARELQKQFGKLDTAWGDVYRVVLADRDPSYEKAIPLTNAPGAGSPEPLGAMRKA